MKKAPVFGAFSFTYFYFPMGLLPIKYYFFSKSDALGNASSAVPSLLFFLL
ncbi:MAG: hypothetical protein JWP37_3693 [Mucilaginibacter sp.]|nr:hypothetical protein [Mucilaginibacter sp.]